MNWEKNTKMWKEDRKRDRDSMGKEESQKRSSNVSRAKEMVAKGTFSRDPEFYMGPQRALEKEGKKRKREKNKER